MGTGKMKLKAELLKMLRDEMMGDEKEEMMKSMMPEKKVKATIMADDEKGLIEGAKKLPEILSKAEKFKRMRMSEMDDMDDMKEASKKKMKK